jgi:hypothetical protein
MAVEIVTKNKKQVVKMIERHKRETVFPSIITIKALIPDLRF